MQGMFFGCNTMGTGKITMTNERGLVGNFVDLCEFNWLDPEDGLSVIGRFMDFCKINELDPLQTASVVADFMKSCGTDSTGGLEILNAQDWDDKSTDERVVILNAQDWDGEPTDEQLRAVIMAETPGS
jgi:hypothetical protein